MKSTRHFAGTLVVLALVSSVASADILTLPLDPPPANELAAAVSVDAGAVNGTASSVAGSVGVLQADLDIDFSDPLNPVIQTIELVGQPGDIQHTFNPNPINVTGTGLDVDVTLTGVETYLTSNGAALPVQANGAFDPAGVLLVVSQGTADVAGTAGGVPFSDQLDLSVAMFMAVLTGSAAGDATVSVVSQSPSLITYEAAVSIDMTDAVMKSDRLRRLLDIGLTGNLAARVQFDRPIPEPTAASLCLLAVCGAMATLRSRRRGGDN